MLCGQLDSKMRKHQYGLYVTLTIISLRDDICLSGIQSHKGKRINSLMAPSGLSVYRIVSPTALASSPSSFAESQGMRIGPEGNAHTCSWLSASMFTGHKKAWPLRPGAA